MPPGAATTAQAATWATAATAGGRHSFFFLFLIASRARRMAMMASVTIITIHMIRIRSGVGSMKLAMTATRMMTAHPQRVTARRKELTVTAVRFCRIYWSVSVSAGHERSVRSCARSRDRLSTMPMRRAGDASCMSG